MSKYQSTASDYVIIGVSILLLFWALAALLVGIVNAQNNMNWCERKDGKSYSSYDKVTPTGRRWVPDVATVGLTGKCIQPGDKGL